MEVICTAKDKRLLKKDNKFFIVEGGGDREELSKNDAALIMIELYKRRIK